MHHFVRGIDHFLFVLVRFLVKGLSWLMSSVITAVTAALLFVQHCSAVAAASPSPRYWLRCPPRLLVIGSARLVASELRVHHQDLVWWSSPHLV